MKRKIKLNGYAAEIWVSNEEPCVKDLAHIQRANAVKRVYRYHCKERRVECKSIYDNQGNAFVWLTEDAKMKDVAYEACCLARNFLSNRGRSLDIFFGVASLLVSEIVGQIEQFLKDAKKQSGMLEAEMIVSFNVKSNKEEWMIKLEKPTRCKKKDSQKD